VLISVFCVDDLLQIWENKVMDSYLFGLLVYALHEWSHFWFFLVGKKRKFKTYQVFSRDCLGLRNPKFMLDFWLVPTPLFA